MTQLLPVLDDVEEHYKWWIVAKKKLQQIFPTECVGKKKKKHCKVDLIQKQGTVWITGKWSNYQRKLKKGCFDLHTLKHTVLNKH